MPSVLLLAYHFPPFGGVAVQRVLRFSRLLPEFGVQPHVVCAEPPAHTSCPLDPELARDLNVSIRRVPSWEPECYANQWSRPWDKVRRNLFKTFDRLLIPDDQALWVPRAVKAGLQAIEQHRPQAIWATGPPFSTLVAAEELSRLSGVPLIADFRDDWTGLNGTYRRTDPTRQRVEWRLEQAVFKQARILSTVTEGIAADVRARHPFPERVRVLPNGFDPSLFSAGVEPVSGLVVYAGTLYSRRDPGPFLKAWRPFAERGCFQVVGRVTDDCRHYFEPCPAGVEFLGFRAHREVIRLSQQAMLNLVILDSEHTHQALTSKLLELLGARRPILLLGPPDSPAGRLVSELRVGRALDPADENGIRSCLDDAFAGRWLWEPNEERVAAFDVRRQAETLRDWFRELQ